MTGDSPEDLDRVVRAKARLIGELVGEVDRLGAEAAALAAANTFLVADKAVLVAEVADLIVYRDEVAADCEVARAALMKHREYDVCLWGRSIIRDGIPMLLREIDRLKAEVERLGCGSRP